MSEVDREITGFSSAREAAHYRDNNPATMGKPSQIQQDNTKVSSNSTDDRHLAESDGSTEQPRKTIQYHKKRPHSLKTFLLAFVIVVVVVFLSCPAIMAVVGWLFRL
jgi:hypothetical protein